MPTTEVEIETERLRLRALRPDDAASIAIQVNDWEVVRYTTSIPYPYDVEMARTFIASQAARWAAWYARGRPAAPLAEEIAFAIARKSDRELVGCIGLQPGETGGLEFGYWVGKTYWNRGYASEAVGALSRFAFETLGVDEIWAAAVPVNDASHRVLEKNGFVIAGAGSRESEMRGHPLPVITRKLTRGQWLAARGHP
ncbi:MAG TPA: GNAT family N-acetyltransferase [Dongiaceae bacterium]|jgi:8-oxo-dGTP diphosphatase|nr:GNAT family N-acetyltransferase [Dongiaceae bacterium]